MIKGISLLVSKFWWSLALVVSCDACGDFTTVEPTEVAIYDLPPSPKLALDQTIDLLENEEGVDSVKVTGIVFYDRIATILFDSARVERLGLEWDDLNNWHNEYDGENDLSMNIQHAKGKSIPLSEIASIQLNQVPHRPNHYDTTQTEWSWDNRNAVKLTIYHNNPKSEILLILDSVFDQVTQSNLNDYFKYQVIQ